MIRLFEIAATELRCPDFGLRLAALQGGTRVMGPIGVVMKNSKTLGEALGYCAKQIRAYCLATRVRFVPNRPNHKLFIGLEILLDGLTDRAQVVEHGLLLASLNVLDITGAAAHVRQVSFRHLPLSALNTSFIASQYPPNTPPMHARVRALINRYLGGEDCTNERIAAELCMHPRTLQRRLKCEGKSFESIKDEVRREVAMRYLQRPDMPLNQVAQKLGYAEQSVLSRSCYRWFAVSPHELREKALAGARDDLEM
jgi:AraC-like DNA-binding protein